LIQKNSGPALPVDDVIQRGGKIDEREMYQVFNMGIGMVAVVAPDKAVTALKVIKSAGHDAWPIGQIVRGTGVTRLE
jgi:phosphoribosylformylglycinamidine cyclo-ligase